MLQNKSIAIIGLGNIGNILIQRLISAGIPPANIVACDTVPSRCKEASDRFGVHVVPLEDELVVGADIILIATPPKTVLDIARALASKLHLGQMVISFAAAVPLQLIENALSAHIAIARVMPCAPSLVGRGINPVCFGKAVTPEAESMVRALLNTLGSTFVVSDAQMNWCVGLTGAAMRSLLPVLEGMTQAGIDAGFSPETSRRIAAQMMQGTAELILQTNYSFDDLKRLTPMQTVDEAGVSQTFLEAVRNAKDKMEQTEMKLWGRSI